MSGREENNSLWKSRRTLPRINTGMSLALWLIAIGASALSVGSVLMYAMLFVSAGCLAFLAVCDRRIVWLLAIPAIYGAAFLVSHDALMSLLPLLCLPLAAALAWCVYREKTLTVTLAVCTVTAVLLFALALAASMLQGGVSIADGVSQSVDDIKQLLSDTLSALQTSSGSGEAYQVLADTDINAMVEGVVMTMPAMLILLAELLSYAAIKLFRFFSLISAQEFMFRGGVWKMSASLPAGLIFVICYVITMFSGGVGVVTYSAANLMYILLFPLAVTGAVGMFGRGSRFRTGMGTPGKVALIALCVISFYLSPLLLPELFAFWASIDALLAAARAFAAGRGGNE